MFVRRQGGGTGVRVCMSFGHRTSRPRGRRPTVAVVASTSDWNAPPRRRSISTVCGPSHREINQFYAHFFPEKEVPQQYGVYNPAYVNQPAHHNVYFGGSSGVELLVRSHSLVYRNRL
ncbi:hypothetical protein Aduo_014345 [Ancylostoma duodenale]